MESLNGKELARRIQLTLSFLKKNRINQADIEQRLNYTSLSKAKNFDRYPQSIIEKKSREELFKELLSSYKLKFDEINDRVTTIGDEITREDNNTELCYLMYFYTFVRETVEKAIVRILNNKKVTIEYALNEHWEGTMEVIENYTFIDVQKIGNTTPVKKLICLFNGTVKFGRPFLIGCYSTVKRDGVPAAGNIIFEKIDGIEEIKAKIKTDVDPKIYRFLNNNVITTDTITPNSLGELHRDNNLINKFADSYKLYYIVNGEIKTCKIELQNSCIVYLNIFDITYKGTFKFLDSHTIKVDVNDRSSFSQIVKEEISLIINTNDLQFSPFYSGYGISNVLTPNKVDFKCLIIPRSNTQFSIGDKEISFLDGNSPPL